MKRGPKPKPPSDISPPPGPKKRGRPPKPKPPGAIRLVRSKKAPLTDLEREAIAHLARRKNATALRAMLLDPERLDIKEAARLLALDTEQAKLVYEGQDSETLRTVVATNNAIVELLARGGWKEARTSNDEAWAALLDGMTTGGEDAPERPAPAPAAEPGEPAAGEDADAEDEDDDDTPPGLPPVLLADPPAGAFRLRP